MDSPGQLLATVARLHRAGYATSMVRHPGAPRVAPRVGAAAVVVDDLRELLTALGSGGAGHAPRSPDLTLVLPELATPLATDVLPAGHARSDAVVLERARQVCRAARNAGVGLTVDTDDRLPVDRMLGILRDLRKDFPETGVVVHAGQRRSEADCRALAHEDSRVRLVRGPLPRRATPAGRDRADRRADRRGDRRGGRALAAYRPGLEADRSFVRCLAALMAGQGTPVVATTDETLLRITAALAGGHARVAGSYELLVPHDVAVGLRDRLHERGEAVRVLVGWGRPAVRRRGALDRVATAVGGAVGKAVGEAPTDLGKMVRALAPRRAPGRARPSGLPTPTRRTRSRSVSPADTDHPAHHQGDDRPVTAILGAGVMGETVLSGLLRSGRPTASVVVGEKRAERARELEERYDVRVLPGPDAVREAATVLLVVKPQDVESLLREVAPALRPGQLVVSLAAGVTTAWLEARLPDGVAAVRVMPNTPAVVDRGMAVVSPGARCTEEQVAEAEALLAGTGRVLRVPESQQDAATAVSGSGPAYVFLVVEAMVEAGVHLGLPRPTATELAVQTVLGAATMVSETGTHPGVLREQVTSPGGTTAAALGVLEQHGLRAAFLDALAAARDRSRALAGED